MKKTTLLTLALLLAAPWSLAQTAKEKTPADSSATVAPKTTHVEEDGDRITIARGKFSDTTKPGTLRLSIPRRKLEIKGTSSDEIIIITEMEQKGKPRVDAEGFRRLDDGGTFDLLERGNMAEMKWVVGEDQKFLDKVKIYVPRNTNLVLEQRISFREITNGKAIMVMPDIEVEQMEGDLSFEMGHSPQEKYTKATLKVEDVFGAVTINAPSHKVELEFEKSPTKPVSIVALRAESIEIELPPDAAADFLLKTILGSTEIRTNFSEQELSMRDPGSQALPGQPTQGRSRALGPQVDVNGWNPASFRTREAQLNGGGTEIQITAHGGTITIRKDD